MGSLFWIEYFLLSIIISKNHLTFILYNRG